MKFIKRMKWMKSAVALAVAGMLVFSPLSPVTGEEEAIPSVTLPSVPRVQLELTGEVPVAEGVEHFTYQGILSDGEPIMVQVIQADVNHPEVTVKPVAAQEGAYGKRESVSAMGSRTGAVAAVNGGFFSTKPPYTPVGSLVIDGELLVSADMWRTSLGWLGDGTFRFGYFRPRNYLELESGFQLAVAGVNQERTGEEEGIILYTPEWGEVAGSGQETELLVALSPREDGSYRVSNRSRGVAAMPAGGIIAALPEEGTGWQELAPGTVVQVRLGQDPYWPELAHLLTAGPLLVENGRPVFQYALEGYAGSLALRHPRTAVGVTAHGKVLLVTVDGRQPGVSAGATFEELAYLMVELGADRAMGLDGGGSTTAWVNGQVVNQVSDGSPRLVANSLVVRSGIAVFIDGKRIYFDVPPRLEEGRTLVPLRAFFEAMGAEVAWQGETRTVLAVKGETNVQLTVGTTAGIVNGAEIPLDVPAKVVDGRTLVPLRFVGEALGAEVIWDPDKIITVNSSGRVSQ